MAFSHGFNPGDSSVTEVADTKQADTEREITQDIRAARAIHRGDRQDPIDRWPRTLARLRRAHHGQPHTP